MFKIVWNADQLVWVNLIGQINIVAPLTPMTMV